MNISRRRRKGRKKKTKQSMKIYTKTGDKGTTALFGGTRVPKYHIRIESYGTVDELNSHLGLIRDQDIDNRYKELLMKIQDRLFTVGAILATDPEKEVLKSGKDRLNIPKIGDSDIELLETEMDSMNDALPPMTHFVLPGGHTTVSYCHIARCVCRRAERLAVLLNSEEPIDEAVLRYLNRLSDYLFVLARKLSNDLQAEEIKWIPEKL
jgi:cob(I)alamin adenosyltransferase